jgi:O-antigen ligase
MMFSVAALAAAMLLKSPRNCSPAKKYFLGASVVLLIVNVLAVMTGRSGYLLLSVCGVTFACSFLPSQRWNGKHLALVLLPAVLVCVTVLAMPGSRNRIEQGVGEAEHYQTSAGLTSIGIRLVFYKNTLQMIAKHPIFGVGTGGFRVAYMQQVSRVKGWEATSTTDPHNQFLKIIAEQGLVGFAILLAFIASAFWQSAEAPYRLLGLGVLCGWCATSLFNSHFSTFSEGRFLFTWLGIMFATLPVTARQAPSV